MRENSRKRGIHNQAVHWIIAVLLAFIAGTLWRNNAEPAVLAQNSTLVGARGVYAFTGQLDHNRYGLFMLDIEQGTIWCYEIDNTGGVHKLRLTAARSWLYDRYLRDFNCAEPDFRAVQDLVAQQRAAPLNQPRLISDDLTPEPEDNTDQP